MELHSINYTNLTNNELLDIFGGKKNKAVDTALRIAGGAASGFTYCSTSGVWHPYALAACAGVGAVGAGLGYGMST